MSAAAVPSPIRPDAAGPYTGPDAPCLAIWRSGAKRAFTAAQFWRLAGRYAAEIARRPDAGRLTLVMSETAIDAIAFFVGGICAGRLVSFFPPSNPIQDSAHYFEQQAKAIERIAPERIVLFDKAAHDRAAPIAGASGAALELVAPLSAADDAAGDWRAARAAFDARLADHAAARPLFVQHSSGTTGLKKAVGIHARQLHAQHDAYWVATVKARISADPSVASWLPLYHDMGLIATLMLPLVDGTPVTFMDPFEWVARPQIFLDMLHETGASLCWMPNFAFRHYTRLRPHMKRRDLSRVAAWISCSETCRGADAEAFEQAYADWGVRPASVVGCYAMAETVFAVSQALPGAHRTLGVAPGTAIGETVGADAVGVAGAKSILSSGAALPRTGLGVYVDGKPAPDGTYGEIGVSGDLVFDGYLGLTREASQITADGVFMTGDLGVARDGEIYVFGRIKDMIIVNGKNLYASDIEALVGGVEGVRPGRVVALGVLNDQSGTEDLVIVAERRDAAGDAQKVAAQVSELVASAFLVKPRRVLLVEDRWLVKSTSGKISRADNLRKYLAQFAA